MAISNDSGSVPSKGRDAYIHNSLQHKVVDSQHSDSNQILNSIFVTSLDVARQCQRRIRGGRLLIDHPDLTHYMPKRPFSANYRITDHCCNT